MLAIKSVTCSYGKRPPFLAGGALMWPVDQYLLVINPYCLINIFVLIFFLSFSGISCPNALTITGVKISQCNYKNDLVSC